MMRVGFTGKRTVSHSHYQFRRKWQGRCFGLMAGVVAAVLIFSVLLAGSGLVGAHVTANDGFNPNANDTVWALAAQPDGKILVGGAFTGIGDIRRNRLARLHPDGSLDTRFNPDANSAVYTLGVQPDGKILVGGAFTSIGGVKRNRIVRLHPDGTLDLDFNPNANGVVEILAVLPDGKILVGGAFTSIGGVERNRIARLHPDGSPDTAFNPDASLFVSTLALQSDGKILVGGMFTSIGGEARNRIARLHPDGTLDLDFNPNANNTVITLALQPDGKILVGGVFTAIGGEARNRIARMNPAGTLDTSFNPDANNWVRALAVQPDGKILVGGDFTSIGGEERNRLARLHPDGTLDTNFNPNANNTVITLALQPDDKILVGGIFDSIGGEERNRLARLNPDGTLDTTIHPVSRIFGSNRYTTAVEVSQAGWPGGADVVLLARGDNFPDSLAGVSLAYQLNAPILLTPSTSLHGATKQEIVRLGASRVIILGGTGAISAGVETELLAMDTVDTVDRLGGGNRYETAKLIAEELDKGASFDTAFLSFGLGFPDALAAASYGAMDGYPILLTGKDSLPQATRDALDTLSSINNIVIVGGEAVISGAVETELINRGLNVQRIMGANRYETAVELAREYLPVETKEVFIATGLNFPDALAGGVLAAKRGSGVLLVRGDHNTLPFSLETFLTERVITRATILGGTSAVSEEIEERLLELLE